MSFGQQLGKERHHPCLGGPEVGNQLTQPILEAQAEHGPTFIGDVIVIEGKMRAIASDTRQRADRLTDMSASDVGMWVLQNQIARHAGAAWLKPDLVTRSAELGYLLDPENWGRGLAVRMAWTVIKQAFSTAKIDRIVSGTDRPNVRSLALMKRLGMQFHANVTYPLGPGVEYVLRRGDPDLSPSPALLRIRE